MDFVSWIAVLPPDFDGDWSCPNDWFRLFHPMGVIPVQIWSLSIFVSFSGPVEACARGKWKMTGEATAIVKVRWMPAELSSRSFASTSYNFVSPNTCSSQPYTQQQNHLVTTQHRQNALQPSPHHRSPRRRRDRHARGFVLLRARLGHTQLLIHGDAKQDPQPSRSRLHHREQGLRLDQERVRVRERLLRFVAVQAIPAALGWRDCLGCCEEWRV